MQSSQAVGFGPRSARAQRAAAWPVLPLLLIGAVLSGSGCAIGAIVKISGAEAAVSDAESAGAKDKAIYRYTMAMLYLEKAHEEWSYSHMGTANDLADKAQKLAFDAKRESSGEIPPPEPPPTVSPLSTTAPASTPTAAPATPAPATPAPTPDSSSDTTRTVTPAPPPPTTATPAPAPAPVMPLPDDLPPPPAP